MSVLDGWRGAVEEVSGLGERVGGHADIAETLSAYADLAPIRVGSPPDKALELAEQTARKLGWEIVEVDPSQGRLEARETSGIFRFVDDVVVRVRPRGAGALVDVRSKSRDGRGDLGANAARIRAFAAEIPR